MSRPWIQSERTETDTVLWNTQYAVSFAADHFYWVGTTLLPAELLGYETGSGLADVELLGYWDGAAIQAITTPV